MEWELVGKLLLFRQDEWSWQGTIAGDAKVFLRRDKTDPRKFTDLNLSTLPQPEATMLVTEFVNASAGISLAKKGELQLSVANHEASSPQVQEVIRNALFALGVRTVTFSPSVAPGQGRSTLSAEYSR